MNSESGNHQEEAERLREGLRAIERLTWDTESTKHAIGAIACALLSGVPVATPELAADPVDNGTLALAKEATVLLQRICSVMLARRLAVDHGTSLPETILSDRQILERAADLADRLEVAIKNGIP